MGCHNHLYWMIFKSTTNLSGIHQSNQGIFKNNISVLEINLEKVKVHVAYYGGFFFIYIDVVDFCNCSFTSRLLSYFRPVPQMVNTLLNLEMWFQQQSKNTLHSIFSPVKQLIGPHDIWCKKVQCLSDIMQNDFFYFIFSLRFEKMENGCRKDLDALKNAFKHNDPVPKFHYENKTFSLVQ